MYSHSYDKVLLSGDFNAQEDETVISNFIYQNNLKKHREGKNMASRIPKTRLALIYFSNNFPNSFSKYFSFLYRTFGFSQDDCHCT